jgi:hypothetical protein
MRENDFTRIYLQASAITDGASQSFDGPDDAEILVLRSRVSTWAARSRHGRLSI